MNKQALPRIVLHCLESCFVFAAMLLALVLEGACVYGLASPAMFSSRPEGPRALTLEWTANTLPRYWLAGALAMLLYRLALMLHPPRAWGRSEVQGNRSALLRLWRWTVVLGCLQTAALYLDWIGFGVR